MAIYTDTQVEKFMSHSPTLLAEYGEYKLWEHPTMSVGIAPIYMSTPSGKLINTGFYELGDFGDSGDPDGLALCQEIEEGY